MGKDTTLAQMGRLVSEAQTGKAPIARLADRISSVFVPIVLVIALGTFVSWLLVTGDMGAAVAASVAVLVIACPCALGLATPIGLLVGTGRGAQLGILIRGPQVLEDTRKVDTVLLDKTGTVTEETSQSAPPTRLKGLLKALFWHWRVLPSPTPSTRSPGLLLRPQKLRVTCWGQAISARLLAEAFAP